MDALLRIPVGIVVERSKATSQWVDFTWRPSSALPGTPQAEPWSVLSEHEGTTVFYAGPSELTLHASDTAQYRDNLSTGQPKLWIVLRETGAQPPFDIVCVTADGSEGEGFTAAGDDVVEHVPMPEPIVAAVDAFVAAHHVERPFHKRQRTPANLEGLGRNRRSGGDST